ncbi:MAG TPA: hypothetical protein VNS34_10705 [Rhizobiaceae bacterium]|nr:hypothetical protein [Rhizobiaceae bacterium]
MKVAELIERLKAFPQDRDVVILDADTEWHLNIEGVGHQRHDWEEAEERVLIWGEYHPSKSSGA